MGCFYKLNRDSKKRVHLFANDNNLYVAWKGGEEDGGLCRCMSLSNRKEEDIGQSRSDLMRTWPLPFLHFMTSFSML